MITLRAILAACLLSSGLAAQAPPAMSLAVQTGNAQLDAALYKAAWDRLSRQYHMTEHGSVAETGLVEIAACGESESEPPSPMETQTDKPGWFTRWEALPKTPAPHSRKNLSQVLDGTIHLLMRTRLPGGKEVTIHRAIVNMTGSGKALRDNPAALDSFALSWVESLLYSVRLNQK